MKRVILTGAAGFVGANLAHRLLREGHEVHLLVRPGGDRWRLGGIGSHVVFHEASLGDRRKLSEIVSAAKPEWIFHLAAHGAYSWQTDAARMVETNVTGTINLLEVCLERGFEAFINTGSSSEYGFKDHPPSERDWLEPNSCYAVTKAAGTQYCRYAARRGNAHVVTLRLYSVYGPYEAPGRLIPALVLNGFKGALPPLAAPEVARDYVYVDDVCDAYLLAASRRETERGAVYNVGTGTQTTLREAVEIARKELRVRAEPEWGAMRNRSWDTSSWVADNRLIHTQLGWRPLFDFAAGFHKTAEWFSGHPDLLGFYGRSAGEVRRR
ncbi:MAG: hypothetical protein A2X28_11330 [Elusimicrobia bacterium GWA2_56_46]|nr:MAG: hypothetical protein A2X28_11330 [Elusimicrobia bacterium GWA2_56_46]OGR54529.1 MAG: hypothetical protein A2X39_10115 [Elusimicrobia bacterium GWC2_56_31]HBB68200.1 hypothetical protein [Elusimicrobiota bacterium]HBW22331.1 hypothetical protein [Elusimicrobiota bacterium]